MKSLVVMTYYQMMHSIALALTFEEKPNLYFSMQYLNPDESLLERIRDTGVFNKVVGITKKGENQRFTRELRKTSNLDDDAIDAIGTSLFDEYLEEKYAEYFKDADTSDELFIYNDFQIHYYYICKHFERIVGVEDGYCSIPRQLGIHEFKGDAKHLVPFIEKGYFPEPLYRHEKVTKIISSVEMDDDYYSSKIVVWDYKDIVSLNEEKFKKALLYIFRINEIEINNPSSLFLGQPLDRAQYCNARENYLLCKKIIRSEIEKGNTVYYKPHPAERNYIGVYGGDNVVVLPKDFPIETLNYIDRKFDRLVTFDSTGLSTLTCAKEAYRYLKLTEFTKKELVSYIKKDISDERIEIDVYLIVRDLTPEVFINVYSCIFRNADIHTNIHILTDRVNDLKNIREFFDKRNLGEMVSAYRKKYKGTKNEVRWHKELGWMKRWIDRYHPSFDVCAVSSFRETDIYREAIACQNDGHDFVLLMESCDPAFLVTKAIAVIMKRSIFPVLSLRHYTTIEGENGKTVEIPLLSDYLNNECTDGLINKVWHKEILKSLEGEILKEPFAGLDISFLKGYIRKYSQIYLYVPPAQYYSIKDGEQHCSEKLKLLEQQFADNQEMLVAKLINAIYDYCDWNRVVNYGLAEKKEIEAIEHLIENHQLQFDVYKRVAAAIFYDKENEDIRLLKQDSRYYQEIRTQIDKAAEIGLLNVLDNIRRGRKKIQKVKKRGRKKWPIIKSN
ncbi:MAG: alpha-2,8-polysialyltransferase family protein [Mogibacterium sp.]|nr:alpha-2,8-polysialyltransferase family protein [Mogibacterium sp.]